MMIYMDTSDVLKLFLEQEGCETVRQLIQDASELKTSVVTYPEARSAFARLARERRIPKAILDEALRDFERFWPTYSASEVDETLAFEAGELAERYRLRGCDSVQLACYARIVRASAPGEVLFSSSDVRLARAAQALASRLLRVPPPWFKAAEPATAKEAIHN